MSPCKVCKKNCPLKPRRKWFQALFWLAVLLTVVECFLVICILLGRVQFSAGSLLYIDLNQAALHLIKIRFESLKDIATTVGLTGILFAWLLQIIGDQTCGIVMDELFQWEYPYYLWQILLFIKSALLCIYTCDSERAGKIVALASFIGMLCGIFNMWLMCTTFLFSTGARRRVGFCFLRVHLYEQWDPAFLESWAQELETCASRGETEYIQAYFNAIADKMHKVKKDPAWDRAEICSNAVTILWEAVGPKKWHTYLPYALRPSSDEFRYDILAAYFLQAAKQQKQVEDATRYQMMLECLGKSLNPSSRLPGYVLETYIALLTIYQCITDESLPLQVLSLLDSLTWTAPIASDSNRLKQILQTAFRHYAVSYTYNYEKFEKKYWTDDLIRKYELYMRVYQ